jgi:hypothetical protein
MASILLSTDGLFTSLYKFRFYTFSQPVSMLRKLILVWHLGWHYRLIMKPNKYLVSVPKRLFGIVQLPPFQGLLWFSHVWWLVHRAKFGSSMSNIYLHQLVLPKATLYSCCSGHCNYLSLPSAKGMGPSLEFYSISQKYSDGIIDGGTSVDTHLNCNR